MDWLLIDGSTQTGNFNEDCENESNQEKATSTLQFIGNNFISSCCYKIMAINRKEMALMKCDRLNNKVSLK